MNTPLPARQSQLIRPGEPTASVLGPADPRRLASAAEELRERTMRLEEAPTFPSFAFVATTLLTVLATSGLALLFRVELRAFFKLLGL